MAGAIGTAVFLAIAACLVFALIKPIYRLLLPGLRLPDNKELVGIVFFLLAVCPFSALLLWAFSLMLVVGSGLVFQVLFPAMAADIKIYSAENGIRFMIGLYVVIFLALFLNGLHGFVKK